MSYEDLDCSSSQILLFLCWLFPFTVQTCASLVHLWEIKSLSQLHIHSLSRASILVQVPCKSGLHIHWFHFLSWLFSIALDTGVHSLLETLSLESCNRPFLQDPFTDSYSLDSLLRLLLQSPMVPNYSTSMSQSPPSLHILMSLKVICGTNVPLDALDISPWNFLRHHYLNIFPHKLGLVSCIFWS